MEDLEKMKMTLAMFQNFIIGVGILILIAMAIIIFLIILRIKKYFSYEEKLIRRLKKYAVYSYSESPCEVRYKEDVLQHNCENNEYINIDRNNGSKIVITEKGIKVVDILSRNDTNYNLFNMVVIIITILISILVLYISYKDFTINLLQFIENIS